MSLISLVPKTADTTVVPSLLSIAKSMRALQGIKLAALGFHNGQDEFMMIANEKGVTVTHAAEQLAIRPSTVSKMMDRLVDKGLMERVADIQDKRRTLIRITPAGVKARMLIIDARRELELELTNAFADHGPVMAASLEECASILGSRLKRLR